MSTLLEARLEDDGLRLLLEERPLVPHVRVLGRSRVWEVLAREMGGAGAAALMHVLATCA